MDKTEIENIIREAIESSRDENGWANLARIGIHLRKSGVDYGKLSKFFVGYGDLVETKVDETIQPPVAYVRLIEND